MHMSHVESDASHEEKAPINCYPVSLMWVEKHCMRQCTVKTSRAVLDLKECICFHRGALHHRRVYVLVWRVFTW